MRKLISLISLLIAFMLAFAACNDSRGPKSQRVVVMWPQEESDPIYKTWKPQLEDSLRGRGLDVEVEHFHLDYYTSGRIDQQNRDYIYEYFLKLDRDSRLPDLVLVYGDEVNYNITFSRQRYQMELPFVFFGTVFPNLNGQLDQHTNITGLYDTIDVRHNIALIDSLHFHYLILTQLDWVSNVYDREVRKLINADMERADTSYITNNTLLDHNFEITPNYRKKKRSFMALNVRNPYYNWNEKNPSDGFTVDYMFTSRDLRVTMLQVKYDPYCYSRRMKSQEPAFFANRAEHLAVNDSCVGGYLVPYDAMLHDVMDYSVAILRDHKLPADLPKRQHTGKDYYVNWPVLRHRGWQLADVPGFVQLRGVTLADTHPVLYRVVRYGSFLLFYLFVALLVYAIVKEVIRRNRLRADRKQRADMALYRQNLSNLVLSYNDLSLIQVKGEEVRVLYSLTEDVHGKSYTQPIPDFIKRFDAPYQSVVEQMLREEREGEYHCQCTYTDHRGQTRWLDLHFATSRHRSRIDRIGVGLNIDALKQQEHELTEARDRLHEANLRDNFMERMSHEFRTPLHGITGFTQLLADKSMPFGEEEIREFKQNIETNSQLLQTLVDDIQMLYSLQSNRIEAQRQCVSLGEVTQRLREHWEPQIGQHNQYLRVLAPDEEVQIDTDPALLQLLLDKIVSNAIKFNKAQGTVTLQWGRKADGCYYSISDTGIGMTEEQQTNLFQHFYKANSFTQGSGLGMTLAKEIARTLDLKIEVRSEVGRGTVFQLEPKNIS